MTAPVRIGLFPYLNVQPLIVGLADEADLEVVVDLPSRIADRFRRGELNLAMVPSFEAATLEASFLDSVCIGCDGPVESVILGHRVALDEIRTLAVDEASRTSAALARILICQASGRLPRSFSFSPAEGRGPEADAHVVIGDPAFTFRESGFEYLDLGQAWREQNSLPFVFAVMAVGSAAPTGISNRLRAALARGLEAVPDIARSYNSGLDAGRAERYLRKVIRYDLGPLEKQGLSLFYRLARANGLLAEAKDLEFHAT